MEALLCGEGGVAGDSDTIASQLSKIINESDPQVNYEVRNYGIGGYHNTQEMILLLEKLGQEKIDFVIFFDWVNEAIMGYREFLDGNNESPFLQPSVPAGYHGMIKFLIEKGYLNEAINLHIVLAGFIESSNFFRIVTEARKSLTSIGKMNNNQRELTEQEIKQAKRIVALYRKNKTIIEALSKSFKFSPYFFMQPSLFTKRMLSNFEKESPFWSDAKSYLFQKKVYEFTRNEFSKDTNFYDISDCINSNETVYLDDVHTTLKGNELIANSIFKKVGAQIILKSKE